nr:MAG TPA: hypothetical protein [Caudoviricetes sp.]
MQSYQAFMAEQERQRRAAEAAAARRSMVPLPTHTGWPNILQP